MNHLTVEIEDTLASLLELASNNDVSGFKKSLERDVSAIDEVGDWYGRKKVMEQRTPLMVAATYGSLDVLRLILAISSTDVNRSCGTDRITALHCAASGGSLNAVEAVKILLSAGADPNCVDANGHRPADVIVVPRRLSDAKATLEDLLGNSVTVIHQHGLRISTNKFNSSSAEEEGSPDSASSPMTKKFQEQAAMPEKKEYPIDPSLPDIKNSIYATDEFRMFSFKVRPCSRAYSHDWTECPFVHPGENARRRDPRKYHYSCVPCPEFRKGACRRADMCEYAHGVFECWLHPAQYRTRLCKDGTNCSRRVCFFAHTNEELRPLYVSTGSAVPSPRPSVSASAMEMAAMGIMPGSPSSISALMSCFTTPMSTPSIGISHSAINWAQPNSPSLHIPGNNTLSSRLRSSLSARDIPFDNHLTRDFIPDFESQQLMNDCLSRMGSSAGNREARSMMLNSNLDNLLSAEVSLSPRYNSEQGAMFSPSHKTAILNQFQQQQSLLTPINTGTYSSKSFEQHLPGHPSLLQASFGLSSPGMMSPRCMDSGSPVSARLVALAQREKQQQQILRSLSSRDLGGGGGMSPVNSPWSKWSSPSRTLDWGVNGEELGHLRRSSSFEIRPGGEAGGRDIEWVQSLVKESPPEQMAAPATSGGPPPATPPPPPANASDGDSNSQIDALGAWLEQLDQMVS
ncbi:Zinc finger CCCH domain-containing protein 24 [Platanthera guangdongensis]|uniref:Zinc finger CCCH domain-containing protein 24 n=1 Tax=Platanthera guangdongensis TaxID=2320717 RepID=A0ABR2LC31_9ASPA